MNCVEVWSRLRKEDFKSIKKFVSRQMKILAKLNQSTHLSS